MNNEQLQDLVHGIKRSINLAAALIASGKYQEAYEALHQAMERVVGLHATCTVRTGTTFSKSNQHPYYHHSQVVNRRAPFGVVAITGDSTRRSSTMEDQAVFSAPIGALTSLSTTATERESLVDSLAVAGAVAFFNMGLACHQVLATSSKDMTMSADKRNRLLALTELHYLQSYEMVMPYALNNTLQVLHVGLCINLMQISHQRGDLTALHTWGYQFLQQTKRLSYHIFPEHLLQYIWTAHLYYTHGLVAAAAA